MINSEVFLELKLKYGPLYSVSVKGIDLLFRELTFAEFDKIDKLQDSGDFSSADAEDYILECTIVYPENFNLNKIPAGAVSSLSQEILDASGFASARTAKRILEQKRFKASEVRTLMKAFVLATINTYSPEDLDNMTFSQLSERVALAEKIIEVQQSIYGIEPTNVKLDLIDPEEEALKEQVIAAQHDAKRKDGEARYNDPIAQKLMGGM
jgi:hypothetical protein